MRVLLGIEVVNELEDQFSGNSLFKQITNAKDELTILRFLTDRVKSSLQMGRMGASFVRHGCLRPINRKWRGSRGRAQSVQMMVPATWFVSKAKRFELILKALRCPSAVAAQSAHRRGLPHDRKALQPPLCPPPRHHGEQVLRLLHHPQSSLRDRCAAARPQAPHPASRREESASRP